MFHRKARSHDPTPHVALCLSAIVALVLILYAAQGPRGTDQYWYIADTATLAGGHAPLSNTWFPMGLLRSESTEYTAPFYHNGPLLHLVAALDSALPVENYAIWIGINVIALATTAWIVWLWLARYTSRSIASWMAAFSLIAPVAIWQTANILRETWFGAISALAIGLFFLTSPRDRLIAEPLLAAVLAAGAFSHPMYLILLLLLLLFRGVQLIRSFSLSNLTLALPALIAIGIIRSYKDGWFPTSFQPSLESIIVSAVPGVTNMAWHFADAQATLDADFLWQKFLRAANRQFLTPKLFPVFLPVNLALISWFALLVHTWRRSRETHSLKDVDINLGFPNSSGGIAPFPLLVLSCFLGLYAAIVVLQQNHFRFQQLIAPALFILIGHATHVYWPRKWRALVMALLLLSCTAVSTLMALQLHNEARAEERDLSILEPFFSGLTPDDRVLFIDISRHDPMSYALRPTPALFIRTSLISEASATEAIEKFSPTHIVTKNEVLPDLLPSSHSEFQLEDRSLTDSFGALVLWSLR